MEEKRLTDEKMSKEVGGIIEQLVISGKKAARGFFDLMVQRTAQSASDLVDKKVNDLTDKIKERDSNDEKKKND